MTITGRFPVLARADAKMCSRLGVRRADIHALETSENARRATTNCRGFATRDLFNWHRPTTIDETRNESCAKSVVDVHHGDV